MLGISIFAWIVLGPFALALSGMGPILTLVTWAVAFFVQVIALSRVNGNDAQ